jgi:hypothetical protein
MALRALPQTRMSVASPVLADVRLSAAEGRNEQLSFGQGLLPNLSNWPI